MIRPGAAKGESPAGEWGLEGRFVVGYSGNMGRAHEFRIIVNAAAAIQGETDTMFLFIGGGAREGADRRCRDRARPRQPDFQALSGARASGTEPGCSRRASGHVAAELEGLIVPSKFYGIAAAARPAIFIGDPKGEIGSEIRASDCGRCVHQGDVEGLVAAIRYLLR